MKKLLKKEIIISFMIGIILASGITACATYTYFADSIKYKDNKNVKQALDELYANIKDVSELNNNFEHISSDITDEHSASEYTYTATDSGQLMVIVYSFLGGTNGSFGDCYCKKNNIELTPTVDKDWGIFRHFREYLISVEKNDVITCKASCSGSMGTNGYVIYYKNN